MKKIAVISSIIIGVFLMSGFATVALVGAEPFQPETERLDAITQSLKAIENGVEDIITPPDPVEPVIKAIERLEAMDKKLQLNNVVLIAVMENVLRQVQPPDPIKPVLVNVKEAAQGIVDIVPPDPVHPFDIVKVSAQTIVNTGIYYLGQLDCGTCSEYTDPGDCQTAGCIWVIPDDPDLLPYCCNTSP